MTRKDHLDKQQTENKKLLVEHKKLLSTIETISKDNSVKDEKISELELRIDHLEQYSRSENVIISNLEIKHTSYANSLKAGTEKENFTQKEEASTENQVISFFEKNGVSLSPNEISACHPVGGKKPHRDIVMRLTNRKSKNRIMFLVKKEKVLKDIEVYVSEHLTRRNQELAAIGRRLRKKNLIAQTWVRDGKIFIKTKGGSP